eukprot:5086029-Alexandrium_andersonii.AAC.1
MRQALCFVAECSVAVFRTFAPELPWGILTASRPRCRLRLVLDYVRGHRGGGCLSLIHISEPTRLALI